MDMPRIWSDPISPSCAGIESWWLSVNLRRCLAVDTFLRSALAIQDDDYPRIYWSWHKGADTIDHKMSKFRPMQLHSWLIVSAAVVVKAPVNTRAGAI